MNDIISPHPIDMPEVLYKYRYFDLEGYHLKIIEDGQLWFTSAKEFNDPFDSALPFQFGGKKELKKAWAKDYIKRKHPNANYNQRRQYEIKLLRNIKRDMPNIAQRKIVESNYKIFGICCLSRFKDNLLMWAHYSNNHKGFCVGLKTSFIFGIMKQLLIHKKEILHLNKVQYEKQIPSINFFKAALQNDERESDILKLLTTKSCHWEYEEEYRLMKYNQINTSVNVGHNAIAEIILGCNIKEDNKQEILRLCDEKNLMADVYEAVKHKSDFALELKKIH